MSVEDLAADDLDHMGPIDYVLIEYPDGQPKGEAAPLLNGEQSRGAVIQVA